MKNIEFLSNKLIAHRGVFDNINTPENSLLAFRKSIINNFIIELDVQLTKDNQLVVFHDYSLKRMTGVNKDLHSLDYYELKKINLLNTKYKIPLFSEVLKQVNGKVPILIEIKNTLKNDIIIDKLIKELDNYNGEFAIQSFNYNIIKTIKKYRKNFIVGLLLSDNISSSKLLIYNYILKGDFISYNKKMYNKVNKNIFSLAWTINNKEEYNKYSKYYNNLICNNINKIKE